MKRKFNILNIIALVALFVSACNSSQQEPIEKIEIDEFEEKEVMIKEVTGYPIPTSIEITELLNEAKAGYIIDLANSIENVNEYITESSKALNLGVYGTDLSYAITYNQTQETMKYFQVCKELIDELNISSAFNDSLEMKIEKNLENKDSLIHIISDSFYETYKYLKTNEQDKLSILVITGSWVESMYITTQMALNSKNNNEIKEIIRNQSSSLSKLLEIMEPVKNDSSVKTIYDGLLILKKDFPVTGEISDERINQVAKEVNTIRSGITKN